MKIRTMLMAAAMCFAIVPMVAYSVVSNIFISQNGQEQFEQQLTEIIANQANTLETYLDSVHTTLNTIVDMDCVKDAAQNGANDEAGNLFVRITNENAAIDSIVLADQDGKIICGKGSGGIVDNYDGYVDYKDEVLYINDVGRAEKTGSIVGSTMFIKKQVGPATLIVYYSISKSTDSNAIDTFLSADAHNSSFYNQGRLIIIDSRMNWTAGEGYNNNLTSQYPEIVTGAIAGLADGIGSDVIHYQTDAGVTSSDAVCAMIRIGGKDGLVALASCPENRSGIFSSTASTSITTVVVLMSIVAIGGAIACAIIVTKPLKVIEETLVKIRRGDHEARINAVSNNEYGQISRAFNDLVDEIVVSEDRYRTITEMSDNIIFEWNFKSNEVFFSNNFNKKFSYRAPSEHFADSFLLKAKIHPEDSERYKSDLEKLGNGEEFKHNEYRMKNIYGDFIWVLVRTATLRDKEGQPLKVVGVMLDIDRVKKSEKSLTERASFDALTELYNRETVENQIDNEINLSEARKSEMAVLFIDVDDFKQYNDNYSHATGDQVLKFVARTVQNIIGEYGFAGRYGGDEFIACIRNAEINDPSQAARDIIARLEEGFTCDGGDHLTISVSIGISVIKDDYNTRVEFLIGRADDAMYSVKKNGKSNYAFI